LAALVKTPSDRLKPVLATFAAAILRAEPRRSSVQLVLSNFADWLDAASEPARPYWLSSLPAAAAHLDKLGEPGAKSLLACFNRCVSIAGYDLVAHSILRYQQTTPEIVAAAAELGSVFARTNAHTTGEKLLAAVPPEIMFDSKDAEALLPQMRKLESAAASDDTVWSAAAAVCVAAARHNASSALNLARQLPSAIAAVPQQSRAAYLNGFAAILDQAGVSLAGWGCKRLPSQFQQSPAAASEFVANGLAIARHYGRAAATDFFEKR
jgi:hypothetical protein